MTIDPTATSYTDNEIVAKVNTATDDITRAGSVDPSARPIETGEIGADEIEDGSVGAVELAPSAARDNLRSMSDVDRGFIDTRPTSGKFKCIAIQRDDAGLLEIEYDDVPEP